MKSEFDDANLLSCSERHSMTSVRATDETCCDPLRMLFTSISQHTLLKTKHEKSKKKKNHTIFASHSANRTSHTQLWRIITHLEVPVHNVMLVDVTDALQDLIDAVAKGDGDR